MGERLTTADRIHRLLAILRIASEHRDGIPVDELADRFGLRRDQLVRELDMASMIGADSPNYHEMPFEIFIDDDRVHCRLFGLDRPLRFTPQEALTLLAATQAVLRDDRADSALRRGLEKIATVLGLRPDESISVDLTVSGGPTGQLVDEAIRADRSVQFRYWTYGTDAVSVRTVDPWTVFLDDGAWYLSGHDHDRDGQRVFRIDRISDPQVLTTPRTRSEPDEPPSATGLADLPIAVLDLDPAARWIVETITVEDLTENDDGSLRITVPVAGRVWLQRLLLRLHGSVQLVSMDSALGGSDPVADAARRILARYRDRDADR